MVFRRKEDIEIWNEFKNGNDEALSFIYHQNAKYLFQYGLKITDRQSIVEDTIHDLFLYLIRNRKSLGSTDNIKFYLFKSFRRQITRHLKKESRYSKFIPELDFRIKPSVEEHFIEDETTYRMHQRVNRAIEKLSDRQKEAIYLRFKQDMEYEEISKILGMGVSASRNLIYRSLKSIRQSLNTTRDNVMFLLILAGNQIYLKKS